MDGGSGRRGKGSGGGARASVPGVGGRDTGPRNGANFATCIVFLLFLTRTKRGGGGRPRALVAGEGWGGRRGDGSSKEGGRGGCKGFGCGGVGGRGGRSKSNAYKKKNGFF